MTTLSSASLPTSSATTSSAHQQVNSQGSSGGESQVASGKKQAPTPPVDALTSTLQNSKLGEDNSIAYSHIDPTTYKKLLLNPNIKDKLEAVDQYEAETPSSSSLPSLPSLSVLLHDRIWAQGGERVIQLGVPKVVEEGGEGQQQNVPRKLLENVELVNVEFTADELQQATKNVHQACVEAGCESVVLDESNSANTGNYAFLMLRRIPSGAQELLELRVAVIGNGEWERKTWNTLHLLTLPF